MKSFKQFIVGEENFEYKTQKLFSLFPTKMNSGKWQWLRHYYSETSILLGFKTGLFSEEPKLYSKEELFLKKLREKGL